MRHYDKYGAEAARDTFSEVKASGPIVKSEKVGAVPAESAAGAEGEGLTAAELEHCKARGLDPILFAERKNAGRKAK